MKTRRHKVGLLDVNVLIALIDPAHEFHSSAHAWFNRNQLTINLVRRILAELVQVEGYRFWPDSFRILEANRFNLADAGSKHLADIYLIGLAIELGGRLVTFDQTIRWQAVASCSLENLELLQGKA